MAQNRRAIARIDSWAPVALDNKGREVPIEKAQGDARLNAGRQLHVCCQADTFLPCIYPLRLPIIAQPSPVALHGLE